MYICQSFFRSTPVVEGVSEKLKPFEDLDSIIVSDSLESLEMSTARHLPPYFLQPLNVFRAFMGFVIFEGTAESECVANEDLRLRSGYFRWQV